MTDLLVRQGPIFNAVAVASTGTATSPVLDLQFLDRIESIMMLCSSSTTAQIKLEHAISYDGVTFGAFGDYPPIIADNTTDFVTPKGWTSIPMPAPLARFIKFKLTGLSSNAADTTVTMYLLLREKI